MNSVQQAYLEAMGIQQWVSRDVAPLEEPLDTDHPVTGRDLILIVGGLFLIGKATLEIYDKVEAAHPAHKVAAGKPGATLWSVLVQIMVLDLVFSLDSVITAVGMADEIGVMITAIIIAVLVMMVSAGAISRFIDAHPTVKMLALSFLLLIGVALMAEGLDQHIPKGYIYFAMAFSVFVEMLNLRLRSIRKTEPPLDLRDSRLPKALEKATE